MFLCKIVVVGSSQTFFFGTVELIAAKFPFHTFVKKYKSLLHKGIIFFRKRRRELRFFALRRRKERGENSYKCTQHTNTKTKRKTHIVQQTLQTVA
jgi:hypothetical protein